MDANLKLIYSEIINAYSSFTYKKNIYYIKHLTTIDSAQIDTKRQQYLEYYISRGAITYNEKLAELINKELWDVKKDKQIEDIKEFIINLKHTKTKYTVKRDMDLVNKEIENYNNQLLDLVIQKEKLVGKTAETYADRKINEYYIYVSLFKDKNLKNIYYDHEEFNNLDEQELQDLIKLYNERISNFNDTNLKKISLSPMFMNLLGLAGDNLYNLFGKALIELTFYQLELIQHGKYFRDILRNCKTPPSPELYQSPDKLLEWFIKHENADKIIEQNSNIEEKPGEKVVGAGMSVVGATKSELKEMGYNTSAQDKIDAELKRRREKGENGELSLQEMHKLGLL